MGAKLSLPPFPESEALSVQRVWTILQTMMTGLYRWHRFNGLEVEIRQQDLLQHSYSITFLGTTLIERFRPFLPTTFFDDHLVLTTLLVHDVPEAILKRDVSLTKKGATDDVAEYATFCIFIEGLPADLQLHLKRAFLLQFALENEKWQYFDDEAWGIMNELSTTRRAEAIMFTIIEHWDYLMYMVEQYEEGNAYLLYECLKREVPTWAQLNSLQPAFGQLLLTPELEAWFTNFRLEYVAQGGDTRTTDEIKGQEP